MKAMWTEEQAEYHGEFVDFDPVFMNPKPVQQPHPPIHVGGAPPWGIRRAVRYGNGWMPIVAREAVDMGRLRTKLNAAAEEAGRDPATLELTGYGTPGQEAIVAQHRDGGADRLVFFVSSASRDQAMQNLDYYTQLIETVG